MDTDICLQKLMIKFLPKITANISVVALGKQKKPVMTA